MRLGCKEERERERHGSAVTVAHLLLRRGAEHGQSSSASAAAFPPFWRCTGVSGVEWWLQERVVEWRGSAAFLWASTGSSWT